MKNTPTAGERFRVYCAACSFETERESVSEALSLEETHRERRGEHHRVTIERLTDP